MVRAQTYSSVFSGMRARERVVSMRTATDMDAIKLYGGTLAIHEMFSHLNVVIFCVCVFCHFIRSRFVSSISLTAAAAAVAEMCFFHFPCYWCSHPNELPIPISVYFLHIFREKKYFFLFVHKYQVVRRTRRLPYSPNYVIFNDTTLGNEEMRSSFDPI